MGQVADRLREQLRMPDPFVDFPAQDYPLQLQRAQRNPLFRRLLEENRPQVIIEIGSWKGDTAVDLACCLQELQIDGAVICIDTWLGSLEHWVGLVPGWDIRPYLRHGYPALYQQFLANVIHSGCAQRVIPIPNTSTNACRYLGRHGVQADLIYVDGSHEEDDVYQDLSACWKLLRPGGALLGDDWHPQWYGVICGVNRFARERGLAIQTEEDKWMITRPETSAS